MNSSIKRYIATIFYSFILIPSLQANGDIIKVINYNIHGLSGVLAGDKNCDRIKFIFENSSKKYDLVLFQENWVYQKLLSNYFDINKTVIGSQTKFLKKDNSKRSNGLNIISNSDIIIEESNEYLFDECNGWFANGSDCFVSKGFIHSRLRIRDYILNLFITHLDAGTSKNDVLVRKEQILHLTEGLSKISANEPIIVCGDFNINYYTEPSFIDDFIDKNNLTILRWDDNTDISDMIDFIFFKNGDNIKINFKDYGIDRTLISYSDHPPIYFNFIMEEIK